jgi:hypothetical protein
MSPVVATNGGTALWYLARGSGVVSLVLLTLSVLLGILTSFRWSSPKWPRFVVEFVHRNVSLLIVVFLAIHIVSVVVDSFAPIRWIDVVIPFISAYRPIWLGLGALAFDLVLALIVTSLLRHRIGLRAWRFVHWFAYACWPVAVVHGLGTGTDTKTGVVLLLTAACVIAVLVAISLRLATGLASRPGARTVGFGLFALAPIVLVAWVVSGPLADGWARRAGTPASVLAKGAVSAQSVAQGAATTTLPPSTTPPSQPSGALPAAGFDAALSGSFHQSAPAADGTVVVRLVGNLSQGASGTLDIEIRGTPLSGGGVRMTDSAVTLTGGDGSRYTGTIVGLDGARVVADLTGPGGGQLQLGVDFTQLDQTAASMAGTVVARPGSAVRGDDGR